MIRTEERYTKWMLFLILIIPVVCFGQMTRTTGKANNIPYVIYKPKVPSDKWVIHLHGLGSGGPSDGSQLAKAESQGYPAKAKAGFEFPFNIIVPQIGTGQYDDFWLLTGTPGTTSEGWFVNYVKETLGASEIIVTGLSLGGRGSWTLLRYDAKKYIKAIAPVCGYYNSNEGPFCNLRRVPGYSVHHVNDMTMRYDWDKGGIDSYVKCSSETQIVDGVSRPMHYLWTLTFSTQNPHDAWTTAYDVTPGKDSLLKWIVQQFSPIVAPTKDPVVEQYFENGQLYNRTQSGKLLRVFFEQIN